MEIDMSYIININYISISTFQREYNCTYVTRQSLARYP